MTSKIFWGFLLSICATPIFGQSSEAIDSIVGKIYNLDFANVPFQLEKLEKSDPQIADYLEFDYLWWKMITSNSMTSELEFVHYKNTFNDKVATDDKDFRTLIYFLYQIRYENFKKTSISSYWTALKCQVYIQKLDEEKATRLKPLEKALFLLILEFDKCLKYKFLDKFHPLSSKNEDNFKIRLENIEKLQNEHYKSFETIKNYFLGKIYLEVAHDSIKAYEKFSKLSDEFPDNAVLKEIKNNCRSDHSVIRL
jgi:hypothetical protein